MYEITFITKEEKNSEVKTILESMGGKILGERFLGRKKFAYPINKEIAGFYQCLDFAIDPEKFLELNSKLVLEKSILRYLIIKKELKKARDKKLEIKVAKETLPTLPKLEKLVKEETILESPIKRPAKAKATIKVQEKSLKPITTVTPPKLKERPKKLIESKEETILEEERLKKLDEKLEELLKE